VTRRFDLADVQWAAVAPLLPAARRPGRPPVWSRRQLIDGIRWRIRVGALTWQVSVDSTNARAYQHAAGARKAYASRA